MPPLDLHVARFGKVRSGAITWDMMRPRIATALQEDRDKAAHSYRSHNLSMRECFSEMCDEHQRLWLLWVEKSAQVRALSAKLSNMALTPDTADEFVNSTEELTRARAASRVTFESFMTHKKTHGC